MAITITLYNLPKRSNSTATPATAGRALECVLKNPTSILNPTITINTAEITENYAQMMGRYYFITDVTSLRNDLWEVQMRVDPLSTYKSGIIGSAAYILYSTVTYNALLVDRRIPVQYTKTIETESSTLFQQIFDINGRYMLTCVGEDGGIDTYVLTAGQFNGLLNNIQEYQNGFDFTWPDKPASTGEFLQDISNMVGYLGDCLGAVNEWINKAIKSALSFNSAADCIRSCFWMPFAPVSTSSAEITLGGYHTGITASRIATENFSEINTLTIPWQFEDWRNSSYCTDMSIYLPFVGTISLPVSQMVGTASLVVRSTLSQKTGDIAVQLICDGVTIGTYGGNCAVAIPVGVSNISPVKLFNSLFSVGSQAASIVGSNNPFGAIGGVVGAVESALTPITSSVGGIGSSAGAGLQMNIVLSSVCHDLSEEPAKSTNIWGRPYYGSLIIPDSGYVQTSGYQFSGACLDSERTMINDFMDGGVYIE